MATMAAFRDRFKDETYFDKPHGREWTIPALDKWLAAGLKELGGVVTKKTDIRIWGQIESKYAGIIFEFINAIMSKGRDPSLTNNMLAAMGQNGQAHQNLGEGYVFWTEDQTGSNPDPAMQVRFIKCTPGPGTKLL